ncbi:AMP-binding protein [Sphingomonas flavalba]|uniref:AMP-binding protein n=1 Tax=Sphingomonas flavalba TaxID=2559804 RepID=UPI0039E08DE0
MNDLLPALAAQRPLPRHCTTGNTIQVSHLRVCASMIEASVPPWFDARLPAGDECSHAAQLIARARDDPEGVFVVWEDGSVWRNANAAAEVRALASRMRTLGVDAGSVVALWYPNGFMMVRALLACSMLGATAALFNIALRGNFLSHALRKSGATLLCAHPDLVARLDGIDTGGVTQILTSGACSLEKRGIRVLDDADIDGGGVVAPAVVHPWHIAVIVFTSGTTGASKGVRVTAAQLWTLGRTHYGFLRPDDRMFLMLPLFHIAALGALTGALSAGASISLAESFKPAEFLDVVARTGATTAAGLNSAWMNMILQASDGAAALPAHRFRICLVTSLDAVARRFSKRLGCDLFAAYGMSEASGIAVSELNPAKDRSVGRLRSGLEGRLVDAFDCEVAPGLPGELIIRAALPWVLNDGYADDAEATTRAWRNGWFHTGDIFRRDADGDLFFVDRNKDVIRRRGENISSLELEAEIRSSGFVRDVAVVGVADESGGGEEVMAVVEPDERAPFDPAALIAFLVPRIPHYMVPRYVRVVDALPRNATNKVTKVALRDTGLVAGTWDREAAGIKIRRERLTG